MKSTPFGGIMENLDPEIVKMLQDMYYKVTPKGGQPYSVQDRQQAEQLASRGESVEQPVLDNSSILDRWSQPKVSYRPLNEQLPENVHSILGGDIANNVDSYNEMLQSQYGDANFLERGARNLIQGAYDIPDTLTGGNVLPDIGNIRDVNKAMDNTEYGNVRDESMAGVLGGLATGAVSPAIKGGNYLKNLALQKLYGQGAEKAGAGIGLGVGLSQADESSVAPSYPAGKPKIPPQIEQNLLNAFKNIKNANKALKNKK